MKQKKKKCSDCGTVTYLWSKNKCKFCHNKQSDSSLKPKSSFIKPSTKPKDPCLEEFFTRNIEKLSKTMVADNGKTIYSPNKSNICHLFPKRRYKSVQCDDDNVVYLRLSDHSLLDENLNRGNLDKVHKLFPTVIPKMKKLLPKVKENGNLKHKIEKYQL